MRGLFVVLEGTDGCGKSTQIKELQRLLTQYNIPSLCLSCPDRTTDIGLLLNEHLKGRAGPLSPQALHLLFSASRWEMQHRIEQLLTSGVTILCDRYAYSGVVYSAAAHNLNIHWCLEPDRGLIRPDIVYQLLVNPIICSTRLNYGSEVYERLELQEQVQKNYSIFHSSDNWHVIDTSTLEPSGLKPSGLMPSELEPWEGLKKNSDLDSVKESISKVHQKIAQHFLKAYEVMRHSEHPLTLKRLGCSDPW